MASEAQKRATAKYNKGNTHQLNIRLFPADDDIWRHLQSKKAQGIGVADYIRQLIRDDM